VTARPQGEREILFEFVQFGAQVRVAAVDALTGTEAIVISPARAARADMEQLALRKLMRLLERRARADEGEPQPPPRPGKFV
jgi:hypothetical protein